MDVLEAIGATHAVRQFQDTPLPTAHIHEILNAGRRAQSWFNRQPWHFLAVRDADLRDKLSVCGRSTWHAAGAALVVVLLIPAENEQTRFHYFDLGQCAAYLQIAATHFGIGSSLATIYEPDYVREHLGIPPEWRASMLISMGYPAEAEIPRPPKKDGRRPFDDVVHWDRW